MRKNFLIVLSTGLILMILFSLFNLNLGNQKKVEERSLFACNTSDFSGSVLGGESLALFEGVQLAVPKLALSSDDSEVRKVLGVSTEERWVEVDLSEQKLKAWEGGRLFLETAVSTGLPWYPTPTGEFRIWIKLRATKMEGGTGKYYYYLPNVPYVMYFSSDKVPSWRGYGLHGTYWHSDFGRQRSHGCVNLPTTIAKELYYWAGPILPEGKGSVRASSENLGTRVIIHE